MVSAAQFSPFMCPGQYWYNTSFQCWSQSHIAIVSVSAMFLVVSVPLSLYASLVLVDRVASPKNVLCQVRGEFTYLFT